MCTGIRDAANLAWKLGHVIKEDAEDDILDSYGLERRPHAQSYVETAIKLGALINSSIATRPKSYLLAMDRRRCVQLRHALVRVR